MRSADNVRVVGVHAEADDVTAQAKRVVDRYARDEVSGPVTVMQLLLATQDTRRAAEAIATSGAAAQVIEELLSLLHAHADGCATITDMLRSGLDSDRPAVDADASIAATRALFDHSVACSEAASVALYSLGDEALLGEATQEIVRVLQGWGVLAQQRDALEIGCGIGRLLIPLSRLLGSIVGIDVSAGMVAAAQRRTAGVPTIDVISTSGRDLAFAADRSFDLVLAVDSFPYIVRSGRAFCRKMFAEVERVLRRHGDFVIFDYSYSHPREQAAAEVAVLAQDVGLSAVRLDEKPFCLWNATAYHLRRVT